ncbi:hypothetical protein L914_21685 [Phytophthora nicotianae]|uniref:DDE-1 domain-containing protein n=1 Tax=Phytophthora nicotianae TaxID=4792 RepID=W2M568_PHYNI|nr:hypothetical protein L914_21685 [Phytophthora nicotianae]
MLQLKAQAVAEDEGLRIRAKTRQGQKKPADMEADAKFFWKNVAQVKEELGVEKVYNADQSGVCFEYLPKHTISENHFISLIVLKMNLSYYCGTISPPIGPRR